MLVRLRSPSRLMLERLRLPSRLTFERFRLPSLLTLVRLRSPPAGRPLPLLQPPLGRWLPRLSPAVPPEPLKPLYPPPPRLPPPIRPPPPPPPMRPPPPPPPPRAIHWEDSCALCRLRARAAPWGRINIPVSRMPRPENSRSVVDFLLISHTPCRPGRSSWHQPALACRSGPSPGRGLPDGCWPDPRGRY